MRQKNTQKLFRLSAFSIALLPSVVLAQNATDDDLDDDILLLSPFEVEASSNVGYLATQTLAGTRIKTDLKDVGSAISVVTKEMLRDTGATDNQTLLTYTTNTEVGGTTGNFTGYTGDSAALDETGKLLRPQTNTRVRGLAQADNTRNFFLSEIPWDGYNTERVDMQRGPNAILFGLGSPAGIINSSTNSANFDSNGGNVEFRIDRQGSFRTSVDYNQIILEDQLAVRFDALYDDTQYRQDPAYETDERMYLALRYAPKSFNTEYMTTTIKANVEHGEIDSNRPRTLTPSDQITPWFDYLNKAGYETIAAWEQPEGENAGAAQASNNDGSANPNYQPWITGSYADSYGGIIISYANPTTQDPSAYAGQYYLVGGRDINGNIDGTIDGTPFTRDPAIASYSQYARAEGLPGYSTGAYKNRTLSDSTIFDFYNNLLDGDSKWEAQNWDSYNINFSQGFFDNRVSYELAFDHQEYFEARESFLNGYQQSIAIDIRTVDSSGTANPNFGKAYVANRMYGGNESSEIERESIRFTVTGELRGSDLFDEDSLAAKLIGRHVFTGLFSQDKSNQDYRQWKRLNVGGDWSQVVGNSNITANDTNAYTAVYLSDSLVNADSASGLNLQRLTANIEPVGGSVHYFDSTWNSTADPAAWWDENGNGVWDHTFENGVDQGPSLLERQAENPDNYVGWTTKEFPLISSSTARDELYTSARLMKNEIESKAFVWQAYLLEGLVVPTFGYREDTSNYWIHDATNDPNILRSDHSVDTSSPYYILPDAVTQSSSGNSTSWSIVAHSPEFINKLLPFNSKISVFYNESENFRPEPGRVDLRGDTLPDPLGDTTDYGFVISAFDGRVNLKVNWFETNVKNATMGSGVGSLSDAIYMIGAAESWGGYYARRYANGEANGWGTWAWSWADSGNYGDYGSYEATVAGQAAALEAWFANEVPQEFLEFWSIDFMDTATNINRVRDDTNWTTPAGLTATSDMTSEGVEYELFIQPTDNWSISINAAKTEASRYNLGQSLEEWILYRNHVFNDTPAGEVRLWWPGGFDALVRDSWNNEIMANYNLFKLLENSSNPEVRPWRFNLITNYYFSEGFLKGFNIGGGYRWQDKSIIGYGLMEDGEGGWKYDITAPYEGPTIDAVDLWVGYEMPLTDKIDWRIQLNIRNLFGKNELLPISTTPSMTDPTVTEVAAWSIAEGMNWSITNTFKF